ncbi:MAG: hypothetical protein D6834_03600 [Aquificota bacterium]|nr:MAG: hypothetical protein D6834_03600 [Aquificota bacterium]
MADNSYIYIKQVTQEDIQHKFIRVIPNPLFPDLPQINPSNVQVFVAGGPGLIYGKDYILIEPNTISFDTYIIENQIGFNQPNNDQLAVSEDDILIVLYCDKNSSNVSRTETFTLSEQDVLNGYVELQNTPDDLDDILIEVRGAPYQLFGIDYDKNTSNPKRIMFKNIKNQLNHDQFIPNVNDIISITYSTKDFVGKRVREVFEIRDNVELVNGRVYLKDKVLLEGSIHAKVLGGSVNIREIDFTADDKSLIWENYELEKQFFTNLSPDTIDYLEVVYHTPVTQLPAKTIVEYANSERLGLTPRLLNKVRDVNAAQDYEVPSENAIANSLNKIKGNIYFQNGNNFNSFKSTKIEIVDIKQ